MVVRKKQKYEFWIDKTAKEIVEREKKLKRGITKIRTEMGIGASGIPHVGSAGDGTRSYGVKLGIENLGKQVPMWIEQYEAIRIKQRAINNAIGGLRR